MGSFFVPTCNRHGDMRPMGGCEDAAEEISESNGTLVAITGCRLPLTLNRPLNRRGSRGRKQRIRRIVVANCLRVGTHAG